MTQSFKERFDDNFNEGEIVMYGMRDGMDEYDVSLDDIKDFIRQEISLAKKEEREKVPEILNQYSEWLSEHGYMDSDWYCEEPKAVDEFIKILNNQ